MDVTTPIYSFSIIVTERCNMHCTYCHFYHSLDRAQANRDIPTPLFETYCHFIRFFAETVPGSHSYRFSGGDPLVLGDGLFALSRSAQTITGMKPYILTAGAGLTRNWIAKAITAGIAHAFVSLENPLNPDPGAPDPYVIMRAIKQLTTPALPLYLGTTVVRNEDFEHIFEIACLVYDQLGLIPNFQEINYGSYERPSPKQIDALYINVLNVVKHFHDKAPLNLFPYISPELASVHQNRPAFLMELNLDNSYGITSSAFPICAERVLDKQWDNYPCSDCLNVSCDWHGQCARVKWLWKAESPHVLAEDKFEDYCRLKQAINSAFYDAIVNKTPSSSVASSEPNAGVPRVPRVAPCSLTPH